MFVLIFVELLWWHNSCIFQITEAVPSWMKTLQSRGKNSVELSHAALLSLHCLGNNKYKGFPKRFATLYIVHSKSTGNDCSFLCG
jgi:hypothetical protein